MPTPGKSNYIYIYIDIYIIIYIIKSFEIVETVFQESTRETHRKLRTNQSPELLKIIKTAQYQLAGIYIKEQTEYIQNKIDKIRDSVED